MEVIDKAVLSAVFFIILLAVTILMASRIKFRTKTNSYRFKGKWFDNHKDRYI